MSNVSFNEDQSRVREGNAAENFAIIRRMALNMLKQEPSKLSIKAKRRKAGWDFTFLCKILKANNLIMRLPCFRLILYWTRLELDDLTDSVLPLMPKANRSNVYRALCYFGINKVPQEKKQQAKKFKEYEPGFLHIDVTYLPKLEGKKHYLFVAIDRATRVIYFRVYDRKTASNAEDFLDKCKSFFPFYISHILTDNGLEFTDKFVGKNKEVTGNHKFDKACAKANIEHRLTKPASPHGMVERANSTIKNATIKAQTYASFDEMLMDLDKFLLFYNFNRSHGGLRKELKVKTPFEALKCWYNLQPIYLKNYLMCFRV